MISIVNQKSVSDGRIYADVFGTSQDTVPTGIFCTGSKMTEVDTGKYYYYDQGAEAWFDPTSETPRT